jgi:HD-like signal output (HDOD) protein
VVIVSSADGTMDDVIEVMRYGAVDFIRKPCSPNEVLAAISRALEVQTRRTGARAAIGSAPASAAAAVATAPAATGFSAILERIQRGDILLPSVPALVEELRASVSDPESTIEKVARHVERDQALAARVLQLGRSAVYARGKQGDDLTSTISRLGFQTLHALIEAVWLNGCFQFRDPRFVPISGRLAKFGLARAIAARKFAVPAKLSPFTAYYSGLFADIGALFLLQVIVEKGAAPDPEAALSFVREHHEPIGAQLLAGWGFNGDLIARVRQHHAPPPNDRAALLCTLAAATARLLTAQDDLTGATPSPETAIQCARALGIDDDQREDLVDAAYAELGAVLDVL